MIIIVGKFNYFHPIQLPIHLTTDDELSSIDVVLVTTPSSEVLRGTSRWDLYWLEADPREKTEIAPALLGCFLFSIVAISDFSFSWFSI